MSPEMACDSPIPVEILVFAEASASVAYGFHDLYQSRVVACQAGPLRVANGVMVQAEASFEDIPIPTVVCTPEVAAASVGCAGRCKGEAAIDSRGHQGAEAGHRTAEGLREQGH